MNFTPVVVACTRWGPDASVSGVLALARVAHATLSPSSPLARLVEVVCVIALGLFAAPVIWHIAVPGLVDRPLTLAGPARPTAATVTATPVSAASLARLTEANPFFPAQPAPETTALPDQVPETSLDLRLSSVFASVDGLSGSATLVMSDGTQERFVTGQEVLPGVVLSQVLSDRVVLTRDGRSEILRMFDRGGAIIDPTPRQSAPAPAAARKVRADAFAGAVDLIPVQENGRLTGYRLVARGDGAALRDAGLSPGDVVRTVNGTPADQADPAVLASSIGPGKTLSLGVVRGGNTVNIRLEFE